MKKSKFFFIESIKTWINLKHVEVVYQTSGWHVTMQNGSQFRLSDAEYEALSERLQASEEEKAERKTD